MSSVDVCDMCGKTTDDYYYIDLELSWNLRKEGSDRNDFHILLCPSCYHKHFGEFIDKISELYCRFRTVIEGKKVLSFDEEADTE